MTGPAAPRGVRHLIIDDLGSRMGLGWTTSSAGPAPMPRWARPCQWQRVGRSPASGAISTPPTGRGWHRGRSTLGAGRRVSTPGSGVYRPDETRTEQPVHGGVHFASMAPSVQ